MAMGGLVERADKGRRSIKDERVSGESFSFLLLGVE